MSIFEGIQFFLANTLQAEERIVLRELLEERGARSVTLPQATHIVTSNLEFEGKGSASVNAIAVSKEWVEKCIIHDRLLSTEGYSADRNKLFSGVVACGAELSDSDVEVLSAGITALGGSWRSGLTKEVTHLFATAPGSEKYNIALYYARDTRVKIVHPLWFDDSIRLGFRALTNAYEYPEPPILEAGDDGASTAAMALSDSRKDIWGGRRVLLSPDLALQPARKQTLELSIGQCGGNNVEGKPESIDIDDFDVLIARYREGSVYVQAVLQDKLVGSLTWLFHVQFAGAFSSPTQSLVHYPIPRNPIDGFPKHRITLTNFQGATRDYLKRLIELAGAVFTPNMAGDNTAVIAASLSGTKADKARSWNIPIVNMSWLEDCFIAWRELPMTDQRYTSLPSDTDILPLHVMGGLNRQALMDEARAIAEEVKAERHGKAASNSPSQRSGAAFSVEKERAADSMHSDDAEAGAMDVDMPTETLKPDRRIGKRRAADLSSDSGQGEEPPHRSVSSNERVGRAKAQTHSRNRRESSATTPPITDDAEQSDDTSAVEDALTRPNGSARQLLHSVDASGPSSPVKVLASPVKRQVSVVLPAPRSTTKISASRTKKRASRVSLDLHESDDEDLLAGLKLSPRKPKTSARQPKKTRSHPPGSDSDQPDLSSTPVSPPKAGEGKGKQRAVSPIETLDSVMPRTRKAVAPTTPTSKHAPSTPARRASSDVVPASKGKKQAPIIAFPDNDAEEHSRTTLSPAEHVTDLTTLSVIGRARRSAATKATQRLHDEIMPDVVNFEKERRRGNVRAIGEKEREAEERIRSKEKRGVEKRRRTSELDEDDEDESEPEPKKRRIGAKLKDKTGATAEDAASAQFSQQEVKIMTTGVSLPDDVNRKLHQLGIRTVLNMKDCTHLIVNRVARTEKFLCAMAIAPVIVDEQWARECATEKRILPTDRYMLRDRDAEKKYKFRLSDALRRAKENGGRLFEGMVFFVTQKVSIDMKLFKAVVAAHGGKVKVQNPTVRSLEGKDEHYVISCAEDITIWRPIAEAGHTIYTTELVLTSALVQEIRWKDPVSVLQ